MIKFNQNAWLKPYIDINTDPRKKAKNDFEKDFLKLINNSVFGKTIENITKYRYIKLATTERIRNYLVSEPNYHTFLVEYLLATETKKVQIFTNKPVYFGLSILELKKKKLRNGFWYDYVNPEHDEKAKLCCMVL